MKSSGLRDLILYGVAILIAGVTVGAHAVPPVVPKTLQQWPETPRIIVCDTAPDWAYDATVKAAKFWRSEGFKIGPVSQGPCNEKCLTYECRKGMVTVDIATATTHKNFEDALAVCHLPEGQPIATWGVIEVVPDPPDSELLLAHELGHCALGYGHVKSKTPYLSPPKGHVMNINLEKGGWSIAGMKP